MCGIAGFYNIGGAPADPTVLDGMNTAVEHRGPDDSGTWIEGPVGLAHRRLSILDLSPLGHQPMEGAGGKHMLTYNGEIYNFVELRTELQSKGFSFDTDSDTEVLLAAYAHWGDRCVDHLVGMYAFVIWDRETSTLFAARDRLGIKPFFYHVTDEAFVFASEIKSLLVHPAVSPAMDAMGIADYLYCGFPIGERTTFSGIKQLLPGHALRLKGRDLSIREYWAPSYQERSTATHEEAAHQLAEILEEAVRIHCRSDAPLGSYASGGLDSSTVAVLAHPYRESMPTFSIKFQEGGPFDESPYARAVGRHIGSQHFESVPSHRDLRELLPFLTWHMDMPMPTDGGFAYFAAARLAREHVTVALTGHGGDEILGGYPAQFSTAFGEGGLPSSQAAQMQEAGAAQRIMGVLRHEGIGGIVSRLVGRVRPSAPPTAADNWAALHTSYEPHQHPGLGRALRSELDGYSPKTPYLRHFVEAPTDSVFDRCLNHDLRQYLPSLLHMEDRASMSVALESRIPMLDHRVVDFLATIPPDTKVPTRTSKELLRTAVGHRLPKEVIERPDKGAFPAPVTQWLSSELEAFVQSTLESERTLDRGVFDADWLRRGGWRGGNTWSTLNVEMWCRMFLDGDTELRSAARDARGGRAQPGFRETAATS